MSAWPKNDRFCLTSLFFTLDSETHQMRNMKNMKRLETTNVYLFLQWVCVCVCVCVCARAGPLPSYAGGGVGLFQRGSQAWPWPQERTSPHPPPLTSPGSCQSQTQLRTGLCVLGRPIERDS